jgi:hypothetical protein
MPISSLVSCCFLFVCGRWGDVSCIGGCVSIKNLYVICPLWICVNYISATMLTKFETKSARVKGLSFHPKRPWVLARYEPICCHLSVVA